MDATVLKSETGTAQGLDLYKLYGQQYPEKFDVDEISDIRILSLTSKFCYE